MKITVLVTLMVFLAYFLVLYGGVGFIQDKRFFSSAPKENLDAIPDTKERFPGAHSIGLVIEIIAILLFLAAAALSVWDGVRNGFCHVLDYAALLALAGVLFGVAYLIYLNKIHEKEIATKLQKNLSFGITVYSGLAGAVVGMTQITTAGVSSVLVWLIVGGVLNFVAGLPIYLSFKKGIFYGVQ